VPTGTPRRSSVPHSHVQRNRLGQCPWDRHSLPTRTQAPPLCQPNLPEFPIGVSDCLGWFPPPVARRQMIGHHARRIAIAGRPAGRDTSRFQLQRPRSLAEIGQSRQEHKAGHKAVWKLIPGKPARTYESLLRRSSYKPFAGRTLARPEAGQRPETRALCSNLYLKLSRALASLSNVSKTVSSLVIISRSWIFLVRFKSLSWPP
jgi:hypothetical protein